jgi:hypothetical protein
MSGPALLQAWSEASEGELRAADPFSVRSGYPAEASGPAPARR